MQKLIEDCYYFFYSTCSKNEACPYRHCQQALGSETVCKNWLNKSCLDQNCPFRHMMITKNRSTILCYWESTPSGCQKPHCPFFHRQKTDSSTTTPQDPSQPPLPPSLTSHRLVITNQIENLKQENEPLNVVSPLIVQMNKEDEDSDNESITITPTATSIKNTTENKHRDFKNIINSNLTKPQVVTIKKTDVETPDLTVEVKTLEEILNEKHIKNNIENTENQESSVNKLTNKSSTESSSSDQQNINNDSNIKIDKRRLKFLNDPEQKPKKITKIKPTSAIDEIKKHIPTQSIKTEKPIESVSNGGGGGGLKIKTLEEIKAEKELKKKMQEEELTSHTNNKTQMEVTISKEEIKNHEEVTNINLTSQASYEKRRLKLVKKQSIVEKKDEEININENKRKISETNFDNPLATPKIIESTPVVVVVVAETTLNENKKLKTTFNPIVVINESEKKDSLITSNMDTTPQLIDDIEPVKKTVIKEIVASTREKTVEEKVKRQNCEIKDEATEFEKEINALMELCDE